LMSSRLWCHAVPIAVGYQCFRETCCLHHQSI
jgi:hypothetical protein